MTSLQHSDLVGHGRAAIAARDWPRALELLREADATGALEANDIEQLAEAAFWTGHLEETMAARDRSYRAFIEDGDVRSAALVALHLSFHHAGRGALTVAGGWLENATSLLEDVPECVEQGWLEWILAIVALDALRDLEGAVRHAERAEQIGRNFNDRDVEALGRLLKGGAFVHLGRIDEGLALLDQVMALAVSGSLGPWASAATYCGTIGSCSALGDYRRAAEWIEEMQRRARTTQVCEFPGDCRLHRAEILQLRGHWSEAEVEAARACDEVVDRAHVALGLHELGMLSLRRGDLAGASDAFRQAEDLAGSSQPGSALLALARGRPESARASLEEALEAARDDPLRRAQLLPVATEAALGVGDAEAARRHKDELAQIAEQYPTGTQEARAAQADGMVALASGDLDLAKDRLRDAVRGWQDVDAPHDEAKVRIDLALALRAAGESDAAAAQLQAALRVFERLGATVDAARVLELMGRAAAQSKVVRTFMFTDVEDSTPLLAAMGDDQWSEILHWHDTTLRQFFRRFNGQEIKQRGGGDGFFVAFLSAESALDCALAIQRAISEDSRAGGLPFRVRIGAHEAEATRSADDYSGRGVHEAARIAALARGGEILASTRTLASAGSRHEATDTRPAQLKGLAEPVVVASLRV